MGFLPRTPSSPRARFAAAAGTGESAAAGTGETTAEEFHGALTEDLRDYISEVCAAYAVPEALVIELIRVETGGTFDRLTVSADGRDFGLMQIREEYHIDRKRRLGVVDILDASGNILVGVDYLAELFAIRDDQGWVLMAYNQGPGNVPFDAPLSAYAERILIMAGGG